MKEKDIDYKIKYYSKPKPPTMGFGIDQLGKQTPVIVKRIRDSFLFIISSSLVATSVLAPKFHMTGEEYGTWSGLALIIVKGLSMMFGVNPDDIERRKDKDD